MDERRILVVEDVVSIRDLYGQIFGRAGYDVRAAESAEEALEIFQREQFWVAFFDLNLPGMNGVELCRRLKAAYPMLSVFAVTGYASLFELSDCREAGFEDYFIKPVQLSLLLDSADRAFKRLARWRDRKDGHLDSVSAA